MVRHSRVRERGGAMGMQRFAGKASGLEGSNKLKEEVG